VSVDLQVREPCEHAALPEVLVSVDALHDPAGAYVGEILVWTDRETMLAALEFAWVTNEMPASLPAIVAGQLSWPAGQALPTLSAYGPATNNIAT
jgi:hypothetical protein